MAITFAVTSWNTTSQNFISKSLMSNFYKKAPRLALLGALTLGNQNKTSLNIGRPGSGEILSGGMVAPIAVKKLGTVNGYIPRAQGFKTSNSTELDSYDDLPDVSNKRTNAHSQANQFGAMFRWGEIVTPILIWHEDKLRCEQENGSTMEGFAIATTTMLQESVEVAYQEHIDLLNANVWNGNPVDQTALLWRGSGSGGASTLASPGACLGILQKCSATNTYGNVNRSTTGNEIWQAKVDSTITTDNIQTILDDYKYTKGIGDTGDGPYLITCASNQYVKFKAQLKASHTLVEDMPAGLPEMAKMGVRRELMRIDDGYIMHDPWLKDNSGTQKVIIEDLSTQKFMVHPQRNFLVTSYKDQTEYGLNPIDADKAYIRTRFMYSDDNPNRSAIYSAISL